MSEFNALKLSFVVALLAALVSLPPAAFAGWILGRKVFRGKSLFQIAVFLPLVLPPVATGYCILLLVSPSSPFGGLGNFVLFRWPGAVLAAAILAFPLATQACRIGFASVDSELEQAARILGATPLLTAASVTVPLCRAALGAGFILALARGLGEFGATILVAGNIPGRTQTLPLALFSAVETGRTHDALILLALSVLLAFGCLAAAQSLSRQRGHQA